MSGFSGQISSAPIASGNPVKNIFTYDFTKTVGVITALTGSNASGQ